MMSADAHRGAALGRRAWTGAAGRSLLIAVGTIVVAVIAAVLTGGLPQPIRVAIVAAVLVVGVLVAVLVVDRRGAEAIHASVEAARAAWAQHHGWVPVADGPADPADVELAVPRGWSVTAARGRIVGARAAGTARAETWVLRAVPGSRRQPRRREIVVVPARTGAVRLAVSTVATADPLLITPAWTRGGRTTWLGTDAEPAWAARVRDRVAAHADLPLTVTVGADRVVVYALDDPRPQTLEARLALATEIAGIVAG